MPISCQIGQYIQISLSPFRHSEMHCAKSFTAFLVPDARDAGQRGHLDVTGVRDPGVGGKVGCAERELVGLQRREQVAVTQLATHHLHSNYEQI